MNFKYSTFSIFIIASSVPTFAMNVKTNLIEAINRQDVSAITLLLQQYLGSLSNQDKYEVVQALNNYRSGYSTNSIQCSEKIYTSGCIFILCGLIWFMSYCLKEEKPGKILDQNAAKQFDVFMSYLSHYKTIIANKLKKGSKYTFGFLSIGFGAHTLFNLIGHLYLGNLENKRFQIRDLFANSGFSLVQ